jgi:hypothetical protein
LHPPPSQYNTLAVRYLSRHGEIWHASSEKKSSEKKIRNSIPLIRMLSRIVELLILATLITVVNLSGQQGMPRWLIRGISLLLLVVGIAAVFFR